MIGPENAERFSEQSQLTFEVLLDEMVEIVREGTQSQLEEFLSTHADQRDQLEKMLPTLQTMALMAEAESTPGDASNDNHETSLSELRALGDFRIVRELGRGGMGIVFEAEQLSMQRRVALKVLPFVALAGETRLKRFRNEVRIAATLDHPNIVSVYSVGEERGIHYYAMQLIRGENLAAHLQQLREPQLSQPQSAPHHVELVSSPVDSTITNLASDTYLSDDSKTRHQEVVKLGIQIALALQHAHDQGIVHRDIKPGNLLVDRQGNVAITDFGLASFRNEGNLTRTGELIGTLRYMSPEQAEGQSGMLDHRTDIYSLAATLYELLTLKPVIEGTDHASLVKQLATRAPTPPREISSAIPIDLETILLKALEHSPVDRYQSAQELADDLRRYSAGYAIHARRPSMVDRIAKWSRRNSRLVTFMGAAALLVCTLLAVSIVMIAREKSRSDAALFESQRHASRVEQLLYTADMRLAYQAWDAEQLKQVRLILNRHIPTGEAIDRRGLEWRLLDSLVREPESVVLGKHEGAANEAAVFANGSKVVTVGDDGQLCIWSAPSRRLLKKLTIGNRPLHAVAVSPDERQLATGNNVLQLWDFETQEQSSLGPAHATTIEAIAFSPDGESIATGSRYDRLRLYSREGRVLHDMDDDTNGTRHSSLSYTTDGKYLLAPSRRTNPDESHSDYIQVWQSDLSSMHRELGGPTEGYADFAYPMGQNKYAVVSDRFERSTRIFQLSTGREVLRLPKTIEKISAIAVSPDGWQIAVGLYDGSVHLWKVTPSDRETLSIVGRKQFIEAHAGRVTSLQFVNSEELVTCGIDGQVKLWQILSQENPKWLPITVFGIAINDGLEQFACVMHRDSLQVRDFEGNVLRQTDVADQDLYSHIFEYSLDGSLLVSYDQQRKRLQRREGRSGQMELEIPFSLGAEGASFCPTREELAIATYQQGHVQFLKPDSFSLLGEVVLGQDGIYSCQYTPDGKYLVCAGSEQGLNVIDAQEYKIRFTLRTDSECTATAMDSSGKTLVSGHNNGSIIMWDITKADKAATLVGHDANVSDLAISPDGTVLASASVDGTVRLWSLTTKQEYGVLCRRTSANPEWFPQVKFSTDGNKLFACFGGPPGVVIFSIDE